MLELLLIGWGALIVVLIVRNSTAIRDGEPIRCSWSIIALMSILLFFAAGFYSGFKNDDSEAANTPTAKPRKTAAANPTATPTAEPDYAAMTAEAAVLAIAQQHESAQIELDYVMELEGLVNLSAVVTDKNWTTKLAMQNLCGFALDVAKDAFVNPGVNSLVFYFDAPLQDEYGNTGLRRVVNITISRETAEKLNYPRLSNRLVLSTLDFLNLTDSYTVHQAFQEGVY